MTSFPNSISSESFVVSISKLYVNPEHPSPPTTLSRRKFESVVILASLDSQAGVSVTAENILRIRNAIYN